MPTGKLTSGKRSNGRCRTRNERENGTMMTAVQALSEQECSGMSMADCSAKPSDGNIHDGSVS
eukprot:1708132-Rhodomonas_salina.1